MIYIGTSGYSYKDWVGPFYPEGMKPGGMLQYYASHFDFVEINSTYYHMPGLPLFSSIGRNTSPEFRVAVKLFGGFTHERTAGAGEAEKFIYSLQPVLESGKLLCLLAQFPYSFHYNEQNADYVKKIREWFGEIPVNVEFRNRQWIRSEVMGMLKKERLGFVCVDEPNIKGLIGNVIASTSQVAYLRLHGRNAGKWYGEEGSERYNYLYSKEELAEWVARVRELEAVSMLTVIAFNNHPEGKAVENARAMAGLLQELL